MAEFDRAVQAILGDSDYIRGIPLKKDATTVEELREFLAEVRPAKMHLLGMGTVSDDLPKVKAAVDELSPLTDLTMDSVRITALVGRDKATGKASRDLTAATDKVVDDLMNGNLGGVCWNETPPDYTDNVAFL